MHIFLGRNFHERLYICEQSGTFQDKFATAKMNTTTSCEKQQTTDQEQAKNEKQTTNQKQTIDEKLKADQKQTKEKNQAKESTQITEKNKKIEPKEAPDEEQSQTDKKQAAKTRKALTDDERFKILHHLLAVSRDGKLPHGTFASASGKFGVNHMTISRIWKSREDVRSKRKGRCGRKRKWNDELLQSLIQSAPSESRTTLKSLSEATGVPATTLHIYLKKGTFQKTPVKHESSRSKKNKKTKDKVLKVTKDEKRKKTKDEVLKKTKDEVPVNV